MAQFPLAPKSPTDTASNPDILAWSQSDIENRFGFKGGRHTGVNHVFAFIIAVLLTGLGYALTVFVLQRLPFANTAAAMLTGLPASVLAGTSQQGRAGGRVDASNVGVSVGVLQGLGGVTSLSFVNPTAAATSILNSALSGKEMYLSGSFAI